MTQLRASVSLPAIVAFWAVAATSAVVLPMTDPDTWWHIRVGDEILASGAIPAVDRWSIAGSGREWVSQDWLSNVLMSIAYVGDRWGPTLVSVVYGLMALGAVWIVWNAIGLRHRAIGWVARASWLLVGLVLAAPVLGARVQVVDLLLAAATLNAVWRYTANRSGWALVALPAIAVAWVNLHAGFPLLFLIGGAVVVGETVDRFLQRAAGPPPMQWLELRNLMLSLLAAGVVLVINPNGAAIYRYPFDTLGIGALASFVGEWQPARLDVPAGQLLAMFVIVGVLPALMLARRLRSSDLLILLGVTFMAITAVRFLLVAGPIGAAIVCIAVAPAVSESKAGRAVAPLIARIGTPRSGLRGTVNLMLAFAVAFIGIGIVTARLSPEAQQGAIERTYPAGALAWIEVNRPAARTFNRYEWGGYLGLNRPDEPVFIDGRADVYGDAVIRRYVEVISVNVDPQAYLEEHAIEQVLYPGDSTLGRWLDDSPRWRLDYRDGVASVWSSR